VNASRAADDRTARASCGRAASLLRALLAAATLACTLAAAATPPTADGATGIAQLRAFLKDTQSARGEFSQRVTGRSRNPQVSEGRFEFQRPGRFRWVYGAPYEQTIVSDGERLYLYDRDLNQVTVRRVQASLPASPASILFGSSDFERDFDVSEAGVRAALAWVSARPRGRDTTFERIEIGLRDGAPAAMRLVDSFGQVSELAFQRLERNVRIDPATFRFVPPAGAEVLEDR
jgi:outer membrane lipoprotein carrier protein